MPAAAPRPDTPLQGIVDSGRRLSRLFWVDTDSHVHQAWREDTGAWPLPAWNVEDLTATSGGTPAAPGTALSAYLTGGGSKEPGQTVRVFYFGADGALRQLTYGHGVDVGVAKLAPTPWAETRLDDWLAGAGPAEGSPLAAYDDNDGVAHLAFLGTDGHFHCGPLDFEHGDVSAESGASAPRPGTPLNAYMDRFGQHHLIYVNSDHHVCELLYDGGWGHNDLTVNGRGRPARADSGLSSAIGIGMGFHYIAYIADDGRPQQLVWHPDDWDDPDENGRWYADGRSQQRPPVPAAAGSPVAQVVAMGNREAYDNERHIVYVEEGSRRFVAVSEMWRFSIDWAQLELSTAGKQDLPPDRRYEGAPVAREGGALLGWWMGTGPDIHAVGVDGDGRLRSFTWQVYNGVEVEGTAVIAG